MQRNSKELTKKKNAVGVSKWLGLLPLYREKKMDAKKKMAKLIKE